MISASGGPRPAPVVIVTGGTRGPGRAAADRLASLGYAVVIGYLDDQREAESAVEAVLDGNGTAVATRVDVGDDLDVERLFAETAEFFGEIDAVVHAVPGWVSPARIGETSVEEFDLVWLTNVRATFVVNRQAARHVRAGGSIVNLCRSVATSALPAYGPNAIASVAAEVLTRALALELRDRDITVNAVSVDAETPGADGRVVDVVAYLLSDEGHGITGHVIHLDDSSTASLAPDTRDEASHLDSVDSWRSDR